MPQSADRKPERYVGPDGKPKIRMVPVDREVIKGEVKKYTPPSQADIDADKKKDRKAQRAAGIKRPSMTPGSLKRRQYSGLLGKLKRESVNEISRSMTPMSKRFGKPIDPKKFDTYKKHVKKHNVDEPTVRFIDDNPNHMQAKRAMKDKHVAQAVKLYKASHKESTNEAVKHTHAAVDKKGLAIGFASHERDAKDMARRNNGKVVKLKKPMSDKKTDMMINRPFKEDVSEISKGMASRYIKKSQVSTADAAKSVERGNIDSKSPDRDIAKAGKAQAKKGIKTFINRNKGTSTAVDKLTGKAKVPAKEGMAQGIAKQKISREKEMDARRHDRMMDRARMKDTKKKNMSELSMSMKDLTKTGLNKAASPDKDKIRKGLDALKKAGNAKADAEAGERRKKMSELSNNKMGQYVRKAADDAAKKGAAGDTKKAQARVKGVSKAMDKMDKNRLFGRQG